ncbi:MAG: tRNA uridine-5-carboxymethylaminomethyl(34) synthesis GTPase MnmE [Pseudomonadota bacterium]
MPRDPSSQALDNDLIVAVATAPGQGGVGIVRLSGAGALQLGQTLTRRSLVARQAIYCQFFDQQDHLIDEGLALWFPEQRSFTGEEVVELQAHGSPVVLQLLLDACRELGARLARPGEFSERAFLHGRMDLAQAEAVADLIAASSAAAARSAVRSLRGDFSRDVNVLADDLGGLRVLVEACIDFPEEEVEHLQSAGVAARVEVLLKALRALLQQCGQGRLMNEGVSVALLGAPNVGKSSLLNVLAGEEAAIVTDIPGTTRDLLKVDLVLDGVPVRLVDTAGLRVTEDVVEKLGVARAREQAQQADLIVLLLDAGQLEEVREEGVATAVASTRQSLHVSDQVPLLAVLNKIDLLEPEQRNARSASYVGVSALHNQGIETLKRAILQQLGRDDTEVPYTARARHIAALESARTHLHEAADQLAQGHSSELIAEALRAAHMDLGEIVGTVTPDDLLGRIFSEFCIGK